MDVLKMTFGWVSTGYKVHLGFLEKEKKKRKENDTYYTHKHLCLFFAIKNINDNYSKPQFLVVDAKTVWKLG